MKIIHIVENLDKGAVENWLVNIFIESKKVRPDWSWTFFCIVGKEGKLDQKVRDAGGEIIYSPVTISDKLGFLKNLRKILKAGKYDILHSHHDFLSGFYLIASAGIKFRKRFLHIHNTDRALPVGNRVLHNLLLTPFKALGLYFSNQVIGISRDTLEDFAGKKNAPNKKFILLYYGVNLERFNVLSNRLLIDQEFNLPSDAKILLYAGRMNDLKNPEFVVDVLNSLLDLRKDVYAVFIGQGDKQHSVKEKAAEYGIMDHVRIFGWHDNVPAVMKNADVFIFPRKETPKEGLGLVVVEAQAAGLPMFITNGIVKDAIVVEDLAHFNTPENPALWAQQISAVLDKPLPVTKEASLQKMKQSPFELSRATKNLVDIYER